MAIDDFEQTQLDLMQRRKKAQEGQTFNAPEGQMVSGRYVAPNFLQVLAEGLRGYGNIQDEKKYDQKLKDLRTDRQTAMADALKGFQTKLEGTPAVAPTTTAAQMPSFDEADAATMGGVQGYGATTGGQKAIAPDALGAYTSLLRSPDSAMRSAGMTGMVSEAKTKADNATQQRHLTNLANATTREDALAAGVPVSLIDAKFRAPIAVGNTLVDASTMKPVYKGQNKPITVGNTLVDSDTFQPVFTAPEKVNKSKDLLIPDENGNLVPNTALINVQSQIKAAGRPPAQERQAQIIQTEQGPMQFIGGKAVPIMGPGGVPVRGASAAEKPLTEGQAKAVAFGSRMQNADQILNDLAKSGTNAVVPGGKTAAMNLLLSKNQQMAVQAQRDFVNAILRRESGAVISDQEFDNASKQYFPQVGDSPEVRAQKAQNRQIAIAGIQADIPQANKGMPSQIIQNSRQGQSGNIVDFGSLK